MRKLAVRWANIYHNERHQAAEKVDELEAQLGEKPQVMDWTKGKKNDKT